MSNPADEITTVSSNGVLTLDGAQGEGGGQILRSALALSLVRGRPFHIQNIRGGRRKPGLLRQHLAAVRAAAAIGNAEAKGARIGSTELAFAPRGVQPGDYRFAVGTAESTVLVLQTVLPALLTASGSSTLRLCVADTRLRAKGRRDAGAHGYRAAEAAFRGR